MKLPIQRSLIVLAIFLTMSTSSLAQYVWIDENGHKQFSDHAPPASVPKSKILKYPSKATDDMSSAPPAADANEKVKQPESLAEKELAYKKRRDELAAKEKKDAADAKAATTKRENCNRLKAYKQTLDSGQNIAQIDATGARSFMTNEKRTQELNELRQNMNECGD